MASLVALTLALTLALAVTRAPAAGLEPGAPTAVLGQPLDFSVQLRTEVGEPLMAECVAAEVTVGDRRVPASQVRTVLEPLGPQLARVRVVTLQGVDEPVIGVQLTVGCQTRVTRRFMVMADLPAKAASPSTSQPSAAAPPAKAVAARETSPRDKRGETSAEPRSPARRVAESTQPAARQAPAAARPAATGARLRLEADTPTPSEESAAIEQAIEVVGQATVALRAAAASASAAELRIVSLERTVDQLRTEARASREQAAQLRANVAEAEAANRWKWPLQLALTAMALLAAALAWRLWRKPEAAHAEWPQSVVSDFEPPLPEAGNGKSPTSPIPFVASEILQPAAVAPIVRQPAPQLAPRLGSAALPPAQAPQAMGQAGQDATAAAMAATVPLTVERTLPLPAAARAGEEPARDVSIEELIDLEQQAEFFVVLGQDDAAIDLLVEHLRNTGGGSPLPYLKLLEIHHRLRDQAAYERTRERFNHRFNAYAPDWAAGLQQGRSLEDYAGVIPRLTQVWPRPLDAMAELEALLFRKSRGELFDLPAYREVLFLYALARDLLDRESADTGSVDLLLPLAHGADIHATRPAPFAPKGGESENEREGFAGHPTAPVDLDLGEPDKPTSIFDPFDERPQAGRSR